MQHHGLAVGGEGLEAVGGGEGHERVVGGDEDGDAGAPSVSRGRRRDGCAGDASAAGMDLEQMQMTMPKPPGFDAGLDKEIDQWLDVMLPRPEFTAGMETVQQGLHQPNAGFPY